jgi:hypothetical protein
MPKPIVGGDVSQSDPFDLQDEGQAHVVGWTSYFHQIVSRTL